METMKNAKWIENWIAIAQLQWRKLLFSFRLGEAVLYEYFRWGLLLGP